MLFAIDTNVKHDRQVSNANFIRLFRYLLCTVCMSIYTVHLKEHGCSGNLASKSCILDDVVATELRELRE